MKPLQVTTFSLFLLFLFTQQVICEDGQTDVEGEPEEEKSQPHLEVTSIISEPWLKVKNANATGNNRFEGYILNLLDEIAEIVGFTYTVRIVLDGKYGGRQDNGEWNGMIGELLNRDVQVAAAPLTITAARQQVVTFSRPFMNFSLGVIVPEGSGITTLQDLVDDENMQYGTIDGSSSMEAFRSTTEEIFVKMWSHIGGEEGENVKSLEEGIKKVASESKNYSFITEGPLVDYYGTNKCKVTVLKEKFLPQNGYGLAMLPDEEFEGVGMDDINNAIQSLEADGVLDDLYNKWFISETCAGCNIVLSSLLLLFCLFLYFL